MMKSAKVGLILILVIAFYGCATDSKETVKSSREPSTVIKGGLLIDGTGKAPIPNSVVVIEGSAIKAVGPLGQVMIPSKARIIEANNKVVLPGLIDMHVHYAHWMDQLFISHGVTTVRDVGRPLNYILEARKQSHREGVKKPRIYTSGPFLDGSPPIFGAPLWGEVQTYPVATPEEAKSAAYQLLNSKVDCFKIQQRMTRSCLEAIMEVAKKEKVVVTAHLGVGGFADSNTGEIKASEAILLGVKGIEHGTGFRYLNASKSELKEFSDMIISHSVFIVPTLFMEEQFSKILDPELQKDPVLKQIPPDILKGLNSFWETTFGVGKWYTKGHSDRHRAVLEKRKEFIRLLTKKGGSGLIVAGTDVTVPFVFPGVSLHREIELLTAAGLTPMQAIMAATKNASGLLGHADRLGTLEEGKIADVLILNANPLEDISNLRSVEMVLRDGKIIWERQRQTK
jgi:imidazolonepropionase-like amidohydrolase